MPIVSTWHSGATAVTRSMMFMLGIFGTKTSPSMHLFNAANHKSHALFQGEPETGHPLIGDGHFAVVPLPQEERDDTPPAADHIAVPDTTERVSPAPL